MATKIDPDAALVKKPTAADKARAEDHLARIKAGLVEAPALLNTFIRQDEWQLLGYASLAECYEKSGLKDAVQQGEVSRKVLVHTLREKGHTVRQIAGVLEISPAQVSRIGSGKTGNEARDAKKDPEDKVSEPIPTPAPVTSDVTSVDQVKDEIAKPAPPEPDKAIKPTRTFTPGEVAEQKLFGRVGDLAAEFAALTDTEQRAFLGQICVPGTKVSVNKRLDQRRLEVLDLQNQIHELEIQRANDKRHHLDEDADYDEVGNMLTHD